jgi:hypothetical protein
VKQKRLFHTQNLLKGYKRYTIFSKENNFLAKRGLDETARKVLSS